MGATHKKKMNILHGVLVIGFSGFIIYLTMTTFIEDEFSMGGTFASAAFYPQLIAGVMIFLAVLLIIIELFSKKERSTPTPIKHDLEGSIKKGDDAHTSHRAFWGSAFILIVYIFCLDKFGYLLTTPFLMAGLFWSLNIRSWKTIILLSIVSSGGVYLFFSVGLDVLLPQGLYLQTID